jgi:hypothetical protein
MPHPTRKALLSMLARLDRDIAEAQRRMAHLADPTNRPLFEELLELQWELSRRIEETLSKPNTK